MAAGNNSNQAARKCRVIGNCYSLIGFLVLLADKLDLIAVRVFNEGDNG